MVGREVMLRVDKTEAKPREVVLQAADLQAMDDRGAVALNGVGFEVREGEVLGIAGVQGNGQTELVEVITGLRPLIKGTVELLGQKLHSIPGTADEATIEAFADAILALDDSVPTGTYVDMCSKLPLVDPARITVPTIVMRGEYDGIAGFDDLVEFWKRLPNADKNFTVMAGISHASFQQKNYRMVYHILHAFFAQPAPAYRA